MDFVQEVTVRPPELAAQRRGQRPKVQLVAVVGVQSVGKVRWAPRLVRVVDVQKSLRVPTVLQGLLKWHQLVQAEQNLTPPPMGWRWHTMTELRCETA
eukprot:14080177-Alexandrium_andersonii.AAC.1